ncbi:MAG: recombinase family protein, partial [Lachnospiraceae bacterium]|nr:recombinase family protein [Lachnospiraceae bacterium]
MKMKGLDAVKKNTKSVNREDIKIAIYIRLSMADEEMGKGKDESNSVVNQRGLIHRFLDNHKELSGCPRTEFVDDGFSGTNTDRPDFQKMIEGIRGGEYSVCITKDFSRFSRDYIEMGDYLECLFPFLMVRYISVNDVYDSAEYKGTTGGLDVVMRTIVYDAYSRDLSVKEMTGKRQSMKKGRRATGMPPYGYMPDPDRKAMNIIDPEAAEVVRKIFECAMKGMSTGEIARMLNQEGILTPGAYYRRNHPDSGKFGYASEKSFWTGTAIWQILGRFAYTGASVGHLRELAAPCSKKSVAVKKEDWIVVSGVQEAIVTEEEFELAQKAIKKTGKARAPERDYPLKSLVVCGNCGRKMVRYEKTKRFRCAYGRNGGAAVCEKMRSPIEADMEKTVFNAIQDYMGMAEKKMIMARGKMSGQKAKIRSNMERLSELQANMEELKYKKLGFYERYCEGYLEKEI